MYLASLLSVLCIFSHEISLERSLESQWYYSVSTRRKKSHRVGSCPRHRVLSQLERLVVAAVLRTANENFILSSTTVRIFMFLSWMAESVRLVLCPPGGRQWGRRPLLEPTGVTEGTERRLGATSRAIASHSQLPG